MTLKPPPGTRRSGQHRTNGHTMKRKILAVGLLALGLLLPANAVQAATPTYGTQINTCRTVPPKLPRYSPACWNLLGNPRLPDECKSHYICYKP